MYNIQYCYSIENIFSQLAQVTYRTICIFEGQEKLFSEKKKITMYKLQCHRNSLAAYFQYKQKHIIDRKKYIFSRGFSVFVEPSLLSAMTAGCRQLENPGFSPNKPPVCIIYSLDWPEQCLTCRPARCRVSDRDRLRPPCCAGHARRLSRGHRFCPRRRRRRDHWGGGWMYEISVQSVFCVTTLN